MIVSQLGCLVMLAQILPSTPLVLNFLYIYNLTIVYILILQTSNQIRFNVRGRSSYLTWGASSGVIDLVGRWNPVLANTNGLPDILNWYYPNFITNAENTDLPAD